MYYIILYDHSDVRAEEEGVHDGDLVHKWRDPIRPATYIVNTIS